MFTLFKNIIWSTGFVMVVFLLLTILAVILLPTFEVNYGLADHYKMSTDERIDAQQRMITRTQRCKAGWEKVVGARACMHPKASYERVISFSGWL